MTYKAPIRGFLILFTMLKLCNRSFLDFVLMMDFLDTGHRPAPFVVEAKKNQGKPDRSARFAWLAHISIYYYLGLSVYLTLNF
jgi:hypothetical protein